MKIHTIFGLSVSSISLLGIALLVFPHLFPSGTDSRSERARSDGTSGGSFEKRLFAKDESVGEVTDILYQKTREGKIGISGLQGAIWLTSDRQRLSSVSIASSTMHVDFLDADDDGTFEFLNRGGSGGHYASLIDANGNLLWKCGSFVGVNDMAAGDLDGDGVAEFVVGYNGGGGVRALGFNGWEKWRQPDGNVWHVEVVDTDGDGSPEIVHSNAGGEIMVRDAAGNVLSRARPDVYFSDFSLCRWPTNAEPQRLLSARHDRIWLLDFDGTTLAELHAPQLGKLGDTHGTLVKFDGDQPPYLAVLVESRRGQPSRLYIYDTERALVFQDTLDEACAAVAAVPTHDGGSEVLLVGGQGKVWEYTLSP